VFLVVSGISDHLVACYTDLYIASFPVSITSREQERPRARSAACCRSLTDLNYWRCAAPATGVGLRGRALQGQGMVGSHQLWGTEYLSHRTCHFSGGVCTLYLSLLLSFSLSSRAWLGYLVIGERDHTPPAF
jgi:hypothetical protein